MKYTGLGCNSSSGRASASTPGSTCTHTHTATCRHTIKNNKIKLKVYLSKMYVCSTCACLSHYSPKSTKQQPFKERFCFIRYPGYWKDNLKFAEQFTQVVCKHDSILQKECEHPWSGVLRKRMQVERTHQVLKCPCHLSVFL